MFKGNRQAGFTLVEMAIVMIIIGLLIAGVLKGQEMIGNARVTATVAQIKAIDGAVSTFKDTYAALPGDMTLPRKRLPNCMAAPCRTNNNTSDGRLSTTLAQAPGKEARAFFPQLSAANLITGIVPGTNIFGGNYQAAKIDGNGFVPGSVVNPATDMNGALGVKGTPSGLFLALMASIGKPNTNQARLGLRPSEAYRIDAKLDDGAPDSGAVVGLGKNSCGAGGSYKTRNTSDVCGLFIRIQG